MIVKAATYLVEEAQFGGYDYNEFIMTDELDNELSIAQFDDLWYVVTWVGDTMRIDRFPKKNLNKRLWKAIYADWRAKCH